MVAWQIHSLPLNGLQVLRNEDSLNSWLKFAEVPKYLIAKTTTFILAEEREILVKTLRQDNAPW